MQQILVVFVCDAGRSRKRVQDKKQELAALRWPKTISLAAVVVSRKKLLTQCSVVWRKKEVPVILFICLDNFSDLAIKDDCFMGTVQYDI